MDVLGRKGVRTTEMNWIQQAVIFVYSVACCRAREDVFGYIVFLSTPKKILYKIAPKAILLLLRCYVSALKRSTHVSFQRRKKHAGKCIFHHHHVMDLLFFVHIWKLYGKSPKTHWRANSKLISIFLSLSCCWLRSILTSYELFCQIRLRTQYFAVLL